MPVKHKDYQHKGQWSSAKMEESRACTLLAREEKVNVVSNWY
jgi:hypothetical protein